MENIRYKRNELCLKQILKCFGILTNLYNVVISVARLLLVYIFKVTNKDITIEKYDETF